MGTSDGVLGSYRCASGAIRATTVGGSLALCTGFSSMSSHRIATGTIFNKGVISATNAIGTNSSRRNTASATIIAGNSDMALITDAGPGCGFVN